MQKSGREAKFLASLKRGTVLSRAQASRLFRLANPSAAVLRFEESGVSVSRKYTRRKSDGLYIVKYSVK